MRRAAKQFHHAFGEDIGDTAEQAGAGDQYREGLKTYRRAAMLNNGVKNAFKWGIPIAIGGGVAGKLANSMLK